MKKIDGKGHHPKVRPYHRRNDKDLKEVRISVCSSLSAWQLAMKRLGICFTASEKNGIGTPSFAGLSLCEAVEQASSATQSVGVGCTDAGGWYVDTSGCGMLQYDDANPPPKNEFTHSVLKVLAILLLLVLVVVASSCNKTPEPNPAPNPVPTDTVTPITPADTITPVVPGDTITPTPGDTIVPEPPVPMDTVKFFINVKNNNIQYPSVDTVKKYKDKVVILKWKIPPNMTANWTPQGFRYPRNNLMPLFALPQQIFGSGKINVNKNYGGASIPCADSLNISVLGMTECDSAIFAEWGFEPWRDPGSKSQREEHFKMLDTIGMSRAILGKQH